MALELPLTPMAHQLRQGNPDRTDAFALATERGGVGQMACLVHSDQTWGQHRTHRPGIHPAIRVPADRAIDRTMVHAGCATNTPQHFLKVGAHHRRPPIVDQHHMVFLRSIQIVRSARPGGKRRIDREILAGRRSRQHPQQRGRILQGRHAFLDTGEDDMDLGQRLRQIAIPLIGDDDAAAGLGDQEIRPGNPHVRRQEPRPQLGPCFVQKISPLQRRFGLPADRYAPS